MLLEWIILGSIFGAIFLWLANSQESFGMAYLAMFIFLAVGLAMMNYGVEIQTGNTINEVGLTTTVVNDYTTYTTANNWIVNLISLVFVYLPFAGILLSTGYALKAWE